MSSGERYICRGDTFIDTWEGRVLIGFKGILEELNKLNSENEDLSIKNYRLYDINKNLKEMNNL